MPNLSLIASNLLHRAPEPAPAPAPTPPAGGGHPAGGHPGAVTQEVKPDQAVHDMLRQQPEQRDTVYRQLARTDPALIHHLERWHQQEQPSTVTPMPALLPRERPWKDVLLPVWLGTPGAGTTTPAVQATGAPAAPPPPDPAAEAQAVLKAGERAWRSDDYDARLQAYAQALSKGDAEYRKQLLAEILERDPGAFQSWLKPEQINNAAAKGRITQEQRGQMAETFAAAYNDGLIPSFQDGATETQGYPFNPVGGSYISPAEQGKAVGEFLDFINAAGSTPETREFRQKYAQYLTDTYALNDRLPVLSAEGHGIQNHAAALAALLVSGDAQHPELASIFLNSLDATPGRLDSFLKKVEAGSVDFTAGFLGPQLNPVTAEQDAQLQRIAQPDALSQLVGAVGRTPGVDADRLAVKLARVPGDHADWLRNDTERADAFTALFDGHSTAILNELTNPDGLPVLGSNGKIAPAFKDRAHDLGALLRLINQASDPDAAARARGHLVAYANQLKENIANATTHEEAIANGRRLGFLGAAVTESVNQAFQDHAKSAEQKRALVSFILDLAASAIPGGSLAKGALGNWINDHIGSEAVREALKGFSGQVIDSATGRLTDEAREHILSHLSDEDIGSLVAQLQVSNEFITDSLFSNLPAPKYEDNKEAGEGQTQRDVEDAYARALDWLVNSDA